MTTDILHSYRVRNEQVKLLLDVDSTFLGIDTAIPLGIVINELFSNSLKYAFPRGSEGEVRISLYRHEAEGQKTGFAEATRTKVSETSSRFTLTYSDYGGRFPGNVDFENPGTLGLQLVNALVEQINGTIELEKENETKFTLRFEDKFPL